MGINQNNSAKSLERLSSGLRINSAADDAAGLSISEKMRGQIRGLNQATRNAQDGISMIQTAEGALNESHSILQRMRELAVQAATDSNTPEDRVGLQGEVNQLATELTRIGDTTEFNTMTLLDGTLQNTTFHIGANANQSMGLEISDMRAEALGVSGDGAGDATFEINALTAVPGTSDIAVLNAGDNTLKVVDFGTAKTVCGEHQVMYGLENEDGLIVAVANKDADVYHFLEEGVKISELEYKAELQGAPTMGTNDGNAIDFDAHVRSGEVTIEGVSLDGDGVVNAEIATTDITASMASAEVERLATGTYTVAESVDFEAEAYFEDITWDATNSAAGSIEQVLLNDAGEVVAIRFDHTHSTTLNEGNWVHIDDVDLEGDALAGPELDTNVLLNGTDTEPIMTTTTGLNDGDTLEIRAEGGIDISSQASANTALGVLDTAIQSVSYQRADLGAMQNRLEHTISNLGTSAENMAAAESRIRDVDMAAEMMEFTKTNILNQAATAMLAQANMAPQTVLQLLG